MLILNNITKQYNNNLVLKGIDLKFYDIGLVSILGPSGCGKSTLLNLIGALDKPTSGSIYIDDKEINKLKKKELNYYYQKKIGFIYQNYNLIEYINVKDNIELINKNKDLDSLLKFLNIFDKKKTIVKNLSGGEKQRVAIARALTNDPNILLCDEPTGALDSASSKIIMDLLKSISKNKLVIMVTHNETLANEYSDRIIKLRDGIVISDTKSKVKESIIKYKSGKTKINILKIFKIIINNIKNKFKRNILTMIAISIGLISLLLVLGISNGFNISIEKEEKDSLSKYPIIITETSTNIDEDLKNIFKVSEEIKDEYIYSKESAHKNKITRSYVNNLEVINNNLEYNIKSYLVDNKLITTTNKKIKELNLLAGKNIEKENELLLITNNHQVEKEILLSLNLNNKKYKIDSLINKKIKIKNKKYYIVGIAEIDPDSYLSDISGLLAYNKNFKKYIPISIMLYPKDYNNKIKVINKLKETPNILYTDYSSSIKNISKTLVNSISIILICFSIISLLVSTIMIGIISYISIIERIKEIGLLKSMGLSNKYIKFIFIGENVILSFISGLISILLMKLISIPVNNTLTNLTGMKNILLINNKIILIIITISIILAIIGSYFPINKTKKLKIIDCLKYE